eukprot:1160804-Pelagomonas_calceolata.AAC.6
MQKNGGGSIVLTSAAVAESGVPHFEAMSAAKAGVEGRACNVHPSSLYVQASSTLACSRVCEDWLTPSLEFLFYMLEPHSIAVPGCQGQEQISSREHPL